MSRRPSEQESLLLRQVAALRRRGHPHDRALELAREGLSSGPLADRVDAALRALAAGAGGQGGRDRLDGLLARGDAPVEALDHAAAAVEAHLAADAATWMVRVYLGLALAGPLLLGCFLGWFGADAFTFRGTLPGDPEFMGGFFGWNTPGDPDLGAAAPLGWQLVSSTLSILRFVGLPLAFIVLALLQRAPGRVAPGLERIRRAAGLFEAAAAGADPAELATDGVERAYLHARTRSCGASGAAVDLAGELVRESERSLSVFRHLAPVVAFLLALLFALPVGFALLAPVVRIMRSFV